MTKLSRRKQDNRSQLQLIGMSWELSFALELRLLQRKQPRSDMATKIDVNVDLSLLYILVMLHRARYATTRSVRRQDMVITDNSIIYSVNALLALPSRCQPKPSCHYTATFSCKTNKRSAVFNHCIAIQPHATVSISHSTLSCLKATFSAA